MVAALGGGGKQVTCWCAKGLLLCISRHCRSNPSAWARPQALMAAIGEKLLISKSDYFVMSRRSGFARQPAVQVLPRV